MLHTWDSGNYFFERPTTADGSNDTTAPPRPPAGYTVKVRDADLMIDLDDLSTDAGGHWDYQADKEAPKMGIQFSTDSGATWSATLWSQQSFVNAMNAGDDASTALTNVTALSGDFDTLSSKVDDLESQIVDSTAGVASIDGKTGALSSSTDLNLVSKDSVGVAGGVASLGEDGKVPSAQLPASSGGSGVPDGGTTGQVLAKDSDADGDASWTSLTASDVGAVSKSDNIAASKITGLASVATSGSYNSLSDRPTIPSTATDVGALPDTYTPSWGSISGRPDFATVATSGNAGDLTGVLSAILNAAGGLTQTVEYDNGWPTLNSTLAADDRVAWHFVGGSESDPPPTAAGTRTWDRPAA